MKIAWFSPFTQKSAIGLVSKYIIEELSIHHHVDLWAHEKTNLFCSDVSMIHYSINDFDINRLSGYDVIFYILGDNYEYHGPIYTVSQLVPGIVILHDYVMHHFFTGYYFLHLQNYEMYKREMAYYYGLEGEQIARDSLNKKRKPIWESNDVIHYPFIEKAIINARGVFTHSEYVKKMIKPTFLGPIEVQYLPHEPFKKVTISPHSNESNNSKKLINITTLGYVNSNRCHEHVIRVMGANTGLKENIKYWIAGPYNLQDPYYQHLTLLINKLGLGDSVVFTGYLSDDDFNSIIELTDIFFNIRVPAMEGGSATLFEEMITGKPVVVADTGVYSEIPDDCVLKINCNDIEIGITKILERFILNHSVFCGYGEKGENFVKESCNIRLYLQSLEKIINEVGGYSPIQKIIDKVGDELREMEVTTDMDFVINDVSHQMVKMFVDKTFY